VKSKTDQSARAKVADSIMNFASSSNIGLSAQLTKSIRDGFGEGKQGEDPFDAAIGLLGMIAVVQGQRPDGIPADPSVHEVEGWILGRDQRKPIAKPA